VEGRQLRVETEGQLRVGANKLQQADIRKLTVEAMKRPEMRDNVLKQLEAIVRTSKHTKEGLAAARAINEIITIEMLEILVKD